MFSVISITRYTAADKQLWDSFVKDSKNGTFLFLRDYMDYHADRFTDYSLLFRDKKGNVVAILPANITEEEDGSRTIHSHKGLTYGGLLYTDKVQAEQVIEMFKAMRSHLASEGISRFIYKPVPHIYHRIPSEEDLYAIFNVFEPRLVARNIASVIDLAKPLKWSENRHRNARKATKAGIIVSRSNDYESFWQILTDNLRDTYGANPIHSLNEMQSLCKAMGNNIQLYAAFDTDGEMLAGTVLYISNRVVHTQYISASQRGKSLHAMDAVFNHLLNGYVFPTEEYSYFDFGTSNEQGGHYLNESLIHQKQGFGGRAIVYDTYEIPL